MGEIANAYRESGRTVDGDCFDVEVSSVASGTAEANLAAGWDETLNGPPPDVWTPAASTWVSLLRSDLQAKDRPNIVPATSDVGRPRRRWCWPCRSRWRRRWAGRTRPIGWADVLALATDPQGWALQGPPRVGQVHARQDQPQRLHLRSRRHHRHAGRGHRHVVRPDPGGAASGRRCSSTSRTSRAPSSTTATPR